MKILEHMLHIKIGEAYGTAFTINRYGFQYIVTARHLLDNITKNSFDGYSRPIILEYSYCGKWRKIPVVIVGIGEGLMDVAVLITNSFLTPNDPIGLTTVGLTPGQSALLLGFPYGLEINSMTSSCNNPLPFREVGIVRELPSSDNYNLIIASAIGRMGFSGGPLVLSAYHNHEVFRIAGVITRSIITVDGQSYVTAVPMEYVLKLIDYNAILRSWLKECVS